MVRDGAKTSVRTGLWLGYGIRPEVVFGLGLWLGLATMLVIASVSKTYHVGAEIMIMTKARVPC